MVMTGSDTLTGSGEIFSSFDMLGRLLETGYDQNATPTEMLLSATNRAMAAIRNLLQSVLPPHSVQRSSTGILHVVSDLLACLLNSVLPLLIRKPKSKRNPGKQASVEPTAVEGILGLLASTICIPLIQAFAPLSISYASSVLGKRQPESSRKGANDIPTDIREDMFNLLRRMVIVLADLTVATEWNFMGGIKEVMALEVLRELEKIYPDQKSDDLAGNSPSGADGSTKLAEERVNCLATKDAIWYLSNIVHLVFTSRMSTVTLVPCLEDGDLLVATNRLLKEGMSMRFSGLLRRFEGCRSSAVHSREGVFGSGQQMSRCLHKERMFGEVGHGMLLAAGEKVWLS